MNNSFFLGLVYNASLLLSMVIVFDIFLCGFKERRSFVRKVVTGMFLAVIGLAVMSTNWEIVPGVIFDTRSVLLAIVGLFFGWIPSIIAMAAASLYRYSLGGIGMVGGVMEIVLPCLIGNAWRISRKKSIENISLGELYIFGVLVQIVVLLLAFFLPLQTAIDVLRKISSPIMIVFPTLTVLIGLQVANAIKRVEVFERLKESEEKYKFLFDTMSQGVAIQDDKGKIIEVNKAASKIMGVPAEQMWGKDSWKLINEDGSVLDPANAPSAVALRTGIPVHDITMGVFVPGLKDYKWILVSSTPRFMEGSTKPYLTLTTFVDITNRVIMEKQLEEREFYIRESQRVAAIGSYKTDFVQGKWVSSEILDNIFGIDKNFERTIPGWLTIVHPEDREMMAGYLPEIFAKHADFDKEYRIKRLSDGETRWVHGLGEITYDKNGKALTMIGTIQDVTDRVNAETAIKESEEKFSKVFTNGPQVITISSIVDGRLLDVNEAFTDILGYEKDEVVGKLVDELNIWADPTNRDSVIAGLRTNKVVKNREYKFRKKNGEVITLLGSATKVTIGDKVYLLLLGIDIEDRKKAEESLAKVNLDILTEKRKLEAILGDMGDAVFVTDENKKIILVNKAMEILFGLAEAELRGKNIEDALALAYETTGNKPVDLIEAVFEKKEQARPVETLTIKNMSGTSVMVDGVASPIVDENKNLVGTVWVLRDVSREKELQKMRTDFISLASHQLRTPLTGIKWFVELLDENALKMPLDKVLEYIRKIGDSNSRMIDLVNDLMTTSRADSGKLAKDISNYKVKDLMQQAIDEQGRIFLDKNITIEGVEKIPEDIMIDADMVQMTQIFGNLFNNAASYSPSGTSIDVEVSTGNGRVKISITDHGMGIPIEQQARVFEKFFRADNVAKTIPGSGLGLYVAKSMIESHGGKIWFESRENLGTTFFVELPIKQKNG